MLCYKHKCTQSSCVRFQCLCNALLHHINFICIAHAEGCLCRNTATGGTARPSQIHTLCLDRLQWQPHAEHKPTALAEDQQQSSHEMCIARGSGGQASHNSSQSHNKAGNVKHRLCLENRYGRLVGCPRDRSFNCLHCFVHGFVIDRKGHDQHMRLHAGQAAAPGTWTGVCTPPQAHSNSLKSRSQGQAGC